MRICIIAPVVLPIKGIKQEYGGIENVIYVFTEELVKRGHEVYLFASGDTITSATLIPVCPKALGQVSSLIKQKNINKIAYKMALAKKPDIIWDHTFALHACKFIRNKSLIEGIEIQIQANELINTGNVPIVHTFHGPVSGSYPKIINGLSNFGHYFISISKDQASRSSKHISRTQHLSTIYHGVDLKAFYPQISSKPKEYYIWVGRYCMEKGPHIALEVAHRLNTPLYFIGKKADKKEIDFFEKFIVPNLWPQDKIIGEVSSDIKAEYMRNAKATLATNLWAEPFGLVIAESMASGTPVVGPAYGSLPELIGNTGILINTEGLGLNENDTQITESQNEYIKLLVNNISKIEKIDPNLPRKRAEYLFSPEENIKDYELIFLNALSFKNSQKLIYTI